MCEEVLENLPDAVWENQTPASLLAVTRELQTKLHQETSDLAVSLSAHRIPPPF
jgi:hypothetical protein